MNFGGRFKDDDDNRFRRQSTSERQIHTLASSSIRTIIVQRFGIVFVVRHISSNTIFVVADKDFLLRMLSIMHTICVCVCVWGQRPSELFYFTRFSTIDIIMASIKSNRRHCILYTRSGSKMRRI